MPTSLSTPIQVNSQSFGDYAGLIAGALQRITGETTDAFTNRTRQYQDHAHTHSYLNSVLDLSAVLGITPVEVMTISGGSSSTATITATSLTILDGENTVTSPFFTMLANGFWSFRKVSDVVNDINATGFWTAALLLDGFAFRMMRQSSTLTQLMEPLTGTIVALQYPNAIPASFTFTTAVPNYTIDSAGRLNFAAALPPNTSICYQYTSWPFTVAASDAVLISATDPALQLIAASPNGGLSYQMEEIAEAAAAASQSYWGS